VADSRLSVPTDISVIGFDDLDLGMLLNPPLTVIDRPSEEQGAAAGKLMLERLRGGRPDVPDRIVMPTRLLARASCAPPRRTRLTITSGGGEMS